MAGLYSYLPVSKPERQEQRESINDQVKIEAGADFFERIEDLRPVFPNETEDNLKLFAS